MLQKTTIRFLQLLKKNNTKSWFDENRNVYERAKQDFTQYIAFLIKRFGKKEPNIAHLNTKDCVFRIHRDVRFSKDKTPYKTNFGASINTDGKKSIKAGYYFHLEPGKSFVGGGLWRPMPTELNKVRQEIDYNLADLKKIIQEKKFIDIYTGFTIENGQLLSRVPKGYESHNPAAEWLRYKSFIALSDIPDNILLGKKLTPHIIEAFITLQPLVHFLNKAIE